MAEARISENGDGFAVAGDISFDDVSALYTRLLQGLDGRQGQPLTIDFGGVERIDSSVVTLLAGLRLSAQQRDMNLRFTGLNAGINSLVTLYGVDWIVDPDQAAA